MRIRFTALLPVAALGACAVSQVSVVGHTRPALPPEQVHIYLQPPAAHYEEIANLRASSGGSFELTAAGKMDKVVERLKREAGKLGANGILLYGVGDQPGPSVGAGVSAERDTGHSPYGLGFGVFTVFGQKAGDGVAIYVAATSGTSPVGSAAQTRAVPHPYPIPPRDAR